MAGQSVKGEYTLIDKVRGKYHFLAIITYLRQYLPHIFQLYQLPVISIAKQLYILYGVFLTGPP